jgi:quinol monooxygenase YgiN
MHAIHERTAMIAVIATLEVHPGREVEFEAEFRALAEKVRAGEPGNHLYHLTRAKRTPQTYRVMELYADKDALKLHGGTDYFKAAMTVLEPLLAKEASIELLDVID